MICLEFPRRACLGAAFFHFRIFNSLVIVHPRKMLCTLPDIEQ